MLDYSDFYDIAVYGNENWKGSFTPKEIACNAYCYHADYEQSRIEGKLIGSMPGLLELLNQDKENGNEDEELKYWIEEIKKIKKNTDFDSCMRAVHEWLIREWQKDNL